MMMAMSTRIVARKRTVAKMKTEKGFLENSNPEIPYLLKRKGHKSYCMGDMFIETIPQMNLGFALHVEIAVVSNCCKEVSELFSHIMAAKKSEEV